MLTKVIVCAVMAEPTYLTPEEAATYMRLRGKRALFEFRYRYGLPTGIRLGKRIVFTKAQLDDAMSHMAERRPGPARIRVR